MNTMERLVLICQKSIDFSKYEQYMISFCNIYILFDF
jgi:hypothetical protein